MGLLAAFQFLTLLPVKRSFTVEQIGRSTAYFPVVGLVIGLILAGIDYVLSLILPAGVVNIFLVIALAAMSGALHLDGLADTLDGLAGHRTTEQRLEIMRDSRVGGFGAIGVALFLLTEYVTLNSIPGNIKLPVLVLAPVLSRWAMVNAIFVYPYARPSGLGRALKDAVSGRQFITATLAAFLLSVVLFQVSGLIIMAFVCLTASLISIYIKSRLKGLTGDTYGAINETAMISIFIIVILLAYNHWLVYIW